MRIKLGRQITALIICTLMVFSVTFTLAMPTAQAGTVNDISKELGNVYELLLLDINGLNDLAAAQEKLAKLNRDPNSEPWPGVFDILLTDQVKSKLGGESVAKKKIIDFACDLATVQYSSNTGAFKKNLKNFRKEHASTVTALFGSDLTIDYLYDYLQAAKGEVPNVITNDVSSLITIASGDYGQVRNSMTGWLREALTEVAAGQYSFFENKLGDLGWSIDKLVDAKDLISAKVDPGYAGEVALVKAYVRSETHFLKGGKEWDHQINVHEGNTLPLKLSILDFPLAGYVLHWRIDDTGIATVNDSTKTLTAVSKGKTNLQVYMNNPDTDWVYQVTVHVTGVKDGSIE